jgi:hypothetical protein
MENKKVTAVEWFYQRILAKNIKEVFEEAKAMEKEQMISAMIYTFNQQNTLPYGMEYLSSLDEMINHCENYLKETYGTHE